MKKTLVTGGCGFVGRHLVHGMLERGGYDVVVVDDLSTGMHPSTWPEHLRCEFHFIEQDCREYFARHVDRFDVVFHLAAVVEGRMTIDGEPLKVARDLAIDSDFFQWATRTDPGRLVYFSSSAAYPIELQTRDFHRSLREDDIGFDAEQLRMPDASYGWAKLTGEYLSLLAGQSAGLSVVRYRPFSGYGEDQAMSYPFPSIVERVLTHRGGPVSVWGSGDQLRDFIHIDDCVQGILGTWEVLPDGGCLNLGAGTPISFRDLIEVIGGALDVQIDGIQSVPNTPEGVFARYCDPSKQHELGFSPSITLVEGIGRAAEYLMRGGSQGRA